LTDVAKKVKSTAAAVILAGKYHLHACKGPKARHIILNIIRLSLEIFGNSTSPRASNGIIVAVICSTAGLIILISVFNTRLSHQPQELPPVDENNYRWRPMIRTNYQVGGPLQRCRCVYPHNIFSNDSSLKIYISHFRFYL